VCAYIYRIISFGFWGIVNTSRIAKAKILYLITATSQAQGQDLSQNSCKRRPCDIHTAIPDGSQQYKATWYILAFHSPCECDCRIKRDALFAFNIYPRISMNALLYRVTYDTN